MAKGTRERKPNKKAQEKLKPMKKKFVKILDPTSLNSAICQAQASVSLVRYQTQPS